MRKIEFNFLENLSSEESIQWIQQRNTECLNRFANSTTFKELQNNIALNISREDQCRIKSIFKGFVYELLRSSENPLGIWSRQSLNDYVHGNSNKEILVDLQTLSQSEGMEWHWQRAFFSPSGLRAILIFSNSGKDESVLREFDLLKREFVVDGFNTTLGKTSVCWVNEDQILIGGMLSSEKTLSGFSRNLHLWSRHQSYESSAIIMEIDEKEFGIWVGRCRDDIKIFHGLHWDSGRFYNFENSQIYPLHLPPCIHQVCQIRNHLIFQIELDWKNFKAGTVLMISLENAKNGFIDGVFSVNLPDPNVHIAGMSSFSESVLLEGIKNCTHHFLRLYLNETTLGVQPQVEEIKLPPWHSIENEFTDESENRLYILMSSFGQAPSLWQVNKNFQSEKLIEFGKTFDFELDVQQEFAKSEDGTKVPYFVIRKAGTSGIAPALQYGYGGFASSLVPWYLKLEGPFWLQLGGVFVVANIRGGAEFGREWHLAARYKNKQKSYDDFIAVSEDLIKKQITKKGLLAIFGGSNGGLLVGNCFVQRPELYEAVICDVPLLDMLRFADLPPGDIWISEYGDPKKQEELEHLRSISPIHNISESTQYPEVLFLTSSADDRVHPSHARRMAAKMLALKKACLFYEETKGGHGSQGNVEIAAFKSALKYAYLYEKLGMRSRF